MTRLRGIGRATARWVATAFALVLGEPTMAAGANDWRKARLGLPRDGKR
jgi:hypothetical protein